MIIRIQIVPEIQEPGWLHHSGFIGISPLDRNIYFWSLKRRKPNCELSLWRVDPAIPNSWSNFRNIDVRKSIFKPSAVFSCDYTQVAFLYENSSGPEMQSEFLLVPLGNGHFEERVVTNLCSLSNEGNKLEFYPNQIAATSVGWLATSYPHFEHYKRPGRKPIWKLFPENKKPKIYAISRLWVDYSVAFTKKSIFYLKEEEGGKFKLICYLLKEDVKIERSLDDFPNAGSNVKLFGCVECAFLVFYYPPHISTSVYKIVIDGFALKLESFAFIPNYSLIFERAVFGENSVAVIDGKCVLVISLGVPSLRYIACYALQKKFRAIGPKGELRDGLTEEELKEWCGYHTAK